MKPETKQVALSYEEKIVFNILNIAGNTTDLQLSIYDMLGRKILSQTVTNQLDVSFLQSGNYIVRQTDGTKTTTSKLIKN